MELASIVVPIYNTEVYLEECLESIVNQTYPHIQVILIDDGSTDNSLRICEEYALKYSNIEVYHQENRGLSAARNAGLDHVRGKYVFFIDSDDSVAEQFIEHFMEIEECPYVGGGYTEHPPRTWQLKYDNYSISMKEYVDNCKANFSRIPSVHVIENRYLYSVIKENNLRFDTDCRFGEDVRFNARYFKYIDELRVIDKCEYYYRIHEASATHKFWPNRLEEERTECQMREELMGESPDFASIKQMHWHIALEHYYSFAKERNPNQKEAAMKLRETVKDSYFRSAIGYMLKNGTKDVKIEAMCLKYGSYRLYKLILAAILGMKRRA